MNTKIGLFGKLIFLITCALIINIDLVNAEQCNETNSPCGGGCTETDLSYMFQDVIDFSIIGNISGWNTSCVTSMGGTFYNSNFNQDISGWDVSQVTSMSLMFYGASEFNQPIGSWDVSQVNNMEQMFRGASSFNQDVGTWNTGLVMNMDFMFLGVNLSTANYDSLLLGWSSKLQSGLTYHGFDGGNSKYSPAGEIGRDILMNTYGWPITDGGVTCDICTETCSPCSGGCTSTDMTSMFADVTDWSNIGNISGWDTSCVTSMNNMFENSNFNQDISSWDVGAVTDMTAMFFFDVEFNQPIGNWNTSKVTSTDSMFRYASSFNQSIGLWDMSNVEVTDSMFEQSSFNQDIGSWNVSNVNYMNHMFSGSDFNQDISEWNIGNVLEMYNMFYGVALSTANYDSLLNGWSGQILQSNVYFDAGDSIYSSVGLVGRNILINNYNWNIVDGGETSSTAKAIIEFTILNQIGVTTIDEDFHTIVLTVPFDVDVTTLVAIFNITGYSVMVGAINQISDLTINNFINPVIYTVIANDSTSQDYVVTVLIENISAINIGSCIELQDMQNNLTASYILTNNINCSDTINWNNGEGFIPIGNDIDYYEGIFDGQNYNITDLYINRIENNNQGLFGMINSDSKIENVGLINIYVLGNNFVGGLVGYINGGEVTNSYSTGNITSEEAYVGGLVGYSDGEISNSYSTGNIMGMSEIGGLVGESEGTIIESYAVGDVTGTYDVGGLVGYSAGEISYSYSAGNVDGTENYIGGLVGYQEYGTIINSYALGNVSGRYLIGGLVGYNVDGEITNSYSSGNALGDEIVGGLVGYNEEGEITNSYSSGNVTGIYEIGGLAGYSDGTIYNSYSSGNVFGDENVGGLVGYSDELISYSYSTGNTTGTGNYVGGLVGYGDGTISYSYSSGNTMGEAYYVGGLVGYNYGLISYSYSTGNTTGGYEMGGLVGYNYGVISYSYSTGNIFGETYVGGLVGRHEYGIISYSYSSGNVIGENYIGGLIGYNYGGTITESYSTINITSGDYVGGLIGYTFNGEISNSYSTGNITSGDYVGGLVGYNEYGMIINSSSIGNMVGNNSIGSLVGCNDGGTIIESYSTGNIEGIQEVGGLIGKNDGIITSSYSTGNVIGEMRIGGLIGASYSGEISNSYSMGNVTSVGDYVGGLVGENDETISNSYSVGNVIGVGDYVGGLVGYNEGEIFDSYYDTNTSGQSTNDERGVPKTTNELKSILTFSNWDITSGSININNNYPYLYWQDDYDEYIWYIWVENNDINDGGDDAGHHTNSCTYNKNYDWACSVWSECINGKQTRICNEQNNCGTNYGKPVIEMNCKNKINKTSIVLILPDIIPLNNTSLIDKTKSNNINRSKALFDIITEIITEPKNAGEDLVLKISLINFGSSNTVDANLEYTIFDSDEKIVKQYTKIVPVTTQTEFLDYVNTAGLIDGKYTLKIELKYVGQTDPANTEKIFYVNGSLSQKLLRNTWVKILLVFIIIIILFLFLFTWLYKRSEKNKLKSEDNDDVKESNNKELNNGKLNNNVVEKLNDDGLNSDKLNGDALNDNGVKEWSNIKTKELNIYSIMPSIKQDIKLLDGKPDIELLGINPDIKIDGKQQIR